MIGAPGTDYARPMAQIDAAALDAVAIEGATSHVRRARVATRLGWAVFAATSAASAAAVGLELRAESYRPLLYVAAAEALALMGVVLTTRMPRHRISWTMAVAGLWWALSSLSNAYASVALVSDPGTLPGGFAAAWFDGWAWLPGLVLFLCALLVLMPDGHLLSRRWWPVPAAVMAGTVLSALALSGARTFDLAGASIANPLAFAGVAVAAAGGLLVITGLGASLAICGARYRRSQGEARQQLRWVIVSACVAVALAFLGALGWGTVPGVEVLPALALVALPAGTAVAVLRFRLYELDLVANRAVVYAVLTFLVIGGYILVVGLVGSYVSRRGDLLLSLVVTGAVVLGFQPLRDRVQQFVDRLMWGERGDPYRALAGLGRTLTSTPQAEAVLPTAVETIGRTLALQYVGLTVRHDVDVARYGTPGAEILVIPLVHQGAAIGELQLSPRPGERLRERDHRLIADLTPQVAAAVHAVGLAHELQAARRHMVELREEERRRIRRDLHDGLGPALAGLTFTLDATRNLIASDPGRADGLLASATTQAQTMIADIRRLIEGMRPPALDQLGLAASLRSLATSDPTLGVDVTIEAPASPELPASVEAAAYWIAQEALTNVRRHAQASTCSIRLAVTADAIRLEIQDDGVGARGASSGLGLHTVAERASEIGGTCAITTPGRRRDDRHRGPAAPPGRGRPMTPAIRILIADDHPLFRAGLRALLDSVSDTEVVGEAATGEEAVQVALALQPDVAIMDINMPGLNGIDATRQIVDRSGAVNVLVVTMHEDDGAVFEAIRAGARGYVLKGAAQDETLRAIRSVANGEAIFSPRIAARLQRFLSVPPAEDPAERFPELTERELEIVQLLAQRRTNAEIAAELFLSPKTVRNYVSAIFAKLKVADRAEAGVVARAAGLGGPDDSTRRIPRTY
jgi:DNA-binding NarL/FixJ family response regulator/signal transduction histidine kinase